MTQETPIWFREVTVAELNRLAGNNMVAHLGIEFTAIDASSLTARMPVDHRTRQPAGLLHGGASVALAETLGSFAAYLTVDDSRFSCVGLEINANHVRAMTAGWVIGTTRPLHLGGRTQIWETRIVDERERLVCISRLTIAVLATPRPLGQPAPAGAGDTVSIE
ncbi:Esterase YdiI [Desulfuromonas sp. DDH964]|uniref:hotdog fold thioesterase n=1 Tax=Desulfuromonas sp. DDH964 TaxID=1823759 RepID=UPI00078B2750|nr:hotdog fold thioesterase [Desulfuromonas sp. DDH964]AMV73386.1 Esterase YdiI [Desulfuromonas sp. DDH964]